MSKRSTIRIAALAISLFVFTGLMGTNRVAWKIYDTALRNPLVTIHVVDSIISSGKAEKDETFWLKLAHCSAGRVTGLVGVRDSLQNMQRLYGTLLQKYAVAIELMENSRHMSDNETYFREYYKALYHKSRLDNSHIDPDMLDIVSSLNRRFQLTAVRYYVSMKLYRDAADHITLLTTDHGVAQDTSAYLAYLLASADIIIKADSASLLRKFDLLSDGIRLSRKCDDKYSEVTLLVSLSSIIRHRGLAFFEANRPGACLTILDSSYTDEESLLTLLSKKALDIAKGVESPYLKTIAMISLADNVVNGDVNISINLLHEALAQQGKHTPPEIEANIYERLSIISSLIGNKQTSDYYRNAYLDILEGSRLDRSQESYYQFMLRYMNNMRNTFAICTILGLITLMIAIVVGMRWRQKLMIRKSRVETLLQKFNTMLLCSLYGKEGDGTNDNINVADYADTGEFGVATLMHNYALAQLKQKNEIEQQREDIEEETRALNVAIETLKEKNIALRMKLSVAESILPYLDRFIKQMRQRTSVVIDNSTSYDADYSHQLLAQIIKINKRLTELIVMSKGLISINVETFALQDIFDSIKRETNALNKKGITLKVIDTELIIKADRALTMFMVNTLVNNAGKFTKNGGTIEVSSCQTDDMVSITIGDTGVGMSIEEVERAMQKRQIKESQISKQPFEERKHGFGIMNCLGIMDKYKKTSTLFRKCSFTIDSTPGRGTKVQFTLPVGIRRIVGVLLLLSFGTPHIYGEKLKEKIPEQEVSKTKENYNVSEHCYSLSPFLFKGSLQDVEEYLYKAGNFADSAYYSNINLTYERTLQFADSVFLYLNEYVREKYSIGHIAVQAYTPNADQSRTAELFWWSQRIVLNYSILLDIRNESAVAELALNHPDAYIYNNEIYLSLYRLITQDRTIGTRIASLNKEARSYSIGIAALAILLVILFILIYIKYMRKSIIHEIMQRHLLSVHSAIISDGAISQRLEAAIAPISAICPIRGWCVHMLQDGDKSFEYISKGFPYSSANESNMAVALNEGNTLTDNQLCYIPVECPSDNEEVHCVVTFALYSDEDYSTSSVELHNMATFVAHIVGNELLCRHAHEEEIEDKQKQNHLLEMDRDRLHIQNAIIENGLSSIKHETMYYPSRLTHMLGDGDKPESDDMLDVASHYRELYSLLLERVEKQLSSSSFRWSFVSIRSIEAECVRMLQNIAAASSVNIMAGNMNVVPYENHEALVYIERDLIMYSLRSIIKMMLAKNRANNCMIVFQDSPIDPLRFVECRIAVKGGGVSFTDSLSIKAFSPERGIEELLVAKEIIKLHNEKTSHSGYRVYAETSADVSSVVFTLLKKQ